MSRIISLVEVDSDGVIDASLRALTFARSVVAAPDALMALVPSSPPTAVAEQLQAFGVTSVAVAEAVGAGQPNGYAPLLLARALESMMSRGEVAAVVAAATDHGNEILAHLGSLTGIEFVANCTEARAVPGGGFELRRHRWGGSLLEDAVLRTGVGLFSAATDAVQAVPAPAAELPEVVKVPVELSAAELALQAAESRPETSGVSLASAKVVVSGGRGIGGPEGFAAVEELAALLGGAVGVSRAVTSLGWRPHREQVGQTGTRVTPDLYLACGISGAIQHLAGCQSAKHMVAINTDPDAPIMSRADWAIIGDASQVLPALVAALKERRSSGG